ncbi:MAG: hypothetical protein DMF93_11740 [Acidobacteria bacterium]|nr:MAG: hypothetical protein DMF93_11740 [Acidobacteriota bacterium]
MPVVDAPGRSLPIALKVNDPVGDGGCITSSRSHRQSRPAFSVWRPVVHVSASVISVTLVVKFEAVFGGDPSC